MVQTYDTFLEVPLDLPIADGDDTITPGEEGAFYEPPFFEVAIPLGVTTPLETIVVPYYHMKPGARGKKVVALNRGLSRAGFRKWQDFSGIWNPWVTKALKKFQKSRKLAQTGVYDRKTHEKLARYYDAYAIKHLLAAPKLSKEQEKRNHFLAELMYIYNRRWNIVYSQRRPFDAWKPPRGLDCSASGEWACKFAGIPSPSGYSSYGWGNTDTQIYQLRRKGRSRPISQAEVGDFVFYGRGGDPSHVAYWIGQGRVWSFGHYPAGIYAWNYRSDSIGLYDLMG